jgi:hypothetical protein
LSKISFVTFPFEPKNRIIEGTTTNKNRKNKL